jgi:hypothetical protein
VPRTLARDLDGSFFAVDNVAKQLLTVDVETGDATALGSVPVVEAITINRMSVPGPAADGGRLPPGTLFATAGAYGELVVMDKTSAAILEIIGWSLLRVRFVGLSFRSDGALFDVELTRPGPPRLFRISTVDGSETLVGHIGPGFGAAGSLAFDDKDNLWVSDIDQSMLWNADQEAAHIRCGLPFLSTFDRPRGMVFTPGTALRSDCAPSLTAQVDFTPRVVNLDAPAPWLNAYIESSWITLDPRLR